MSLANLTPIATATGPVLEALLQQYTEDFAGNLAGDFAGSPPAAAPGGHLVGMLTAAGRRPAARAAMLRHILHVAIPSGRVVVSTSWPPYRVLAENLGLRTVGDTMDDLFRCGRRNRVLERTFAADSIGPWLRRMERAEQRPDPLVEAVRGALAGLRTRGRWPTARCSACPGWPPRRRWPTSCAAGSRSSRPRTCPPTPRPAGSCCATSCCATPATTP
ncbi:hypothetical protein ACFQ9X_42355 [Catenulispora yoronensis]